MSPRGLISCVLKVHIYFFAWFHLCILAGGTSSFHRTVAVTDFEPTDARMAFPCFDEPSFKANFSIKIRRESGHIALSNMPKVLPLSETLENHSQVELWSLLCYFKKYFLCFQDLSHYFVLSIYIVRNKLNLILLDFLTSLWEIVTLEVLFCFVF